MTAGKGHRSDLFAFKVTKTGIFAFNIGVFTALHT